MPDLENILIEAVNEHKIPAPTNSWSFISDALRKKRKRRAAWFFVVFFGILCIIAGNFFLLNNESTTKSNISKRYAPTSIGNGKAQNNIEPVINNDKNKNNKETKIDTFLRKSDVANNPQIDSIKEEIVTAIITPSVEDGIKCYKVRKTYTDASSIIENKNNADTVFEKTVHNKKIKSVTNSKIKSPLMLEDFDKLEENKVILKSEKNETSAIVNEKNDNIVAQKMADALKEIIRQNDSITSTKENRVKEEISKSKLSATQNTTIKKWKPYLSISYGALFASSKNFFKNANELNSNNFASPTTAAQPNFVSNNNNANYQTGKQLSVSLLLKNEHKKLHPMVGVSIEYGSFNTKAYNASGALLDAANAILDSTQTSNSIYASRNTIGGNLLKVKNNIFQIGFLIGCDISLFTFKQKNKILIQSQVIPTYTLSQSIQWYDNKTTRYFTSKEIGNRFNITQSTALLWQANFKNNTFLIGPYVNFNYLKLNKSVNIISNIYTQSVGAQIQIKLKK
jgi:hypothetical protein